MTGERNLQKASKPRIGLATVPQDPIDRLLTTDAKLIRLGALIRQHQGELRGFCSEDAWRTHLRIEELINERMFTLADILLKRP